MDNPTEMVLAVEETPSLGCIGGLSGTLTGLSDIVTKHQSTDDLSPMYRKGGGKRLVFSSDAPHSGRTRLRFVELNVVFPSCMLTKEESRRPDSLVA